MLQLTQLVERLRFAKRRRQRPHGSRILLNQLAVAGRRQVEMPQRELHLGDPEQVTIRPRPGRLHPGRQLLGHTLELAKMKPGLPLQQHRLRVVD